MSEFYIVATPIGNLSDITMRALETLRVCDVILCEDTRVTSRLLQKYDIKNKKLVIYNDNSEENSREKILNMALNGLNIALVSDAGTPLISDPGYKLIEYLRKNNIKITPIPGPSSVISALCASGLAIDSFLFIGFLPNSQIQRKKIFENLPRNFTFSFFESANRLEEALDDILSVLGNRKISVAKELTKIHEEIVTDEIKVIIEFFKNNQDKLRGEFVVTVEKAERKEQEIPDEDLEKEIKKLLKSGISLKDLSQNLAEIYGLNKKIVYKKALDLV